MMSQIQNNFFASFVFDLAPYLFDLHLIISSLLHLRGSMAKARALTLAIEFGLTSPKSLHNLLGNSGSRSASAVVVERFQGPRGGGG